MHPFLQLLRERLVYFDGSMGAVLQAMGLEAGKPPAMWSVEHPDRVKAVQTAYLDAGADVILSNTFGFNPDEYPDLWETVIRAGVGIAKDAVLEAGHGFAALDLTSLGALLKPWGGRDFEEAADWYEKFAAVGINAGCDLIVVETMTCLREIKAAILGIQAAKGKTGKEIPVVVSMSFDEGGRLLTGSDIEGAAAMLTAMDGVDVLGLNCQSEPKALFDNLKRLLACADGKPVLFMPNAGIPELIGGRTVFHMKPQPFADDMAEAVRLGARVVGGCCGTTDQHIAALVKATKDMPFALPETEEADGLAPCWISGHSQSVRLGAKPIVIGERLNPTGKKRMKQALREGDMDYLLSEATTQIDTGADVLDVNVGMPELDEVSLLRSVVETVQTVAAVPLQIDTSSPAALEQGLRAAIGKPIINSVSGKQSVMDEVFPLAKRYGAALVALCLDENGIPETAQGRIDVAQRILDEAAKYGIDRRDLLFDGLTMAAAADAQAPSVTLDTIRRLHDELRVKTVLGVSNVSFGLPNRSLITSSFLSMALKVGLSAAIINPMDQQVISAFDSACAVLGYDAGFSGYIDKYSAVTLQAVAAAKADGKPADAKDGAEKGSVIDAVVSGLESAAGAAAKALLDSGSQPLQVIEEHVIPALTEVGARYESGKIFLPQLMQSAAAAKKAIAVATADMPPADPDPDKTIVLATVKGDVHDIGKNIVSTMLSSYGFHMEDLGRDVPKEAVLEALQRTGAKLLGLSALMTTTVPSMQAVIDLVRETLPHVKIMVGGAVLTPSLATEIGADFYAADAMASVRIAKETLGG